MFNRAIQAHRQPRSAFKPLIGPPLPIAAQRLLVDTLAALMPGRRDVRIEQTRVADRRVEIVHGTGTSAPASASAILCRHGGAFCLGSPRTHRSVTTHLAQAAARRGGLVVPVQRLLGDQRQERRAGAVDGLGGH